MPKYITTKRIETRAADKSKTIIPAGTVVEVSKKIALGSDGLYMLVPEQSDAKLTPKKGKGPVSPAKTGNQSSLLNDDGLDGGDGDDAGGDDGDDAGGDDGDDAGDESGQGAGE